MLRLYSKGCEHVLRALISIPPGDAGKVFSLKTICSQESIPLSFTKKMFHHLVQQGLLHALQGPGGGYRFKIPPSDITVLQIIESVDGPDALHHCVLGSGNCGQGRPCSLHLLWKQVQENLVSELNALKLQELMAARASGSGSN